MVAIETNETACGLFYMKVQKELIVRTNYQINWLNGVELSRENRSD